LLTEFGGTLIKSYRGERLGSTRLASSTS
jgi:hypothetical protein